MSNRTCARLSVAKVIAACKSAIFDIKTKRASMLEERIIYYQDKRRAGFFYPWPLGEMSRERAVSLVHNGAWLQDHRWYAWGTLDVAERVLALAKATHALEMDISSEDFGHIESHY